jgi:PAS domain S-box-containing protein
MLDEIHRTYTQKITLCTLARTLGRQSAYLGQLFRDEIGVTVHEYVTRARMVHSAVHVRSGVKIEAVALDLGYLSKKNFYRQFKRRFGMTPEAYRHEYRDAAVGDPAPRSSQLATGQSKDRASRPVVPGPQILRRALAGSCIAMMVTNDTGCYIGANKTAVSMTGYSVDELRGKAVEVLFPYVSGSDTKCRLQILLPASSSLQTNTLLYTKSAGPVRVHLTSAVNLLEDRRGKTAVL